MPPKKAKGRKAVAAEPSSRRSTRGAKQESTSSEPLQELLPPTASDVAAKVATVLGGAATYEESQEEPVKSTSMMETPDIEMGAVGAVVIVPHTPSAPALTMEQRQGKLDALRDKMQSAAKANREDLLDEHQRQMTTARDLARLEKQRKLAALLREKADAEDKGLDSERKKNWEYTIEENDAWEKRLKRKKGRADFEFHDDNDAARKRYKKDLDALKPDLDAYARQKEAALGLVPGALSKAGSSKDGSVIAAGPLSVAARMAAEDLYRDGNSLAYGDSKPSEDAIDRVVSKMNQDLDKKGKFSRKRVNEEEGDITYINEHNKVFNKKIARYYDKYTKDIRDSFERGTAL